MQFNYTPGFYFSSYTCGVYFSIFALIVDSNASVILNCVIINPAVTSGLTIIVDQRYQTGPS